VETAYIKYNQYIKTWHIPYTITLWKDDWIKLRANMNLKTISQYTIF